MKFLLKLRSAAVLAILTATFSVAAIAGDDAPAWLRQAASVTPKAYDKKVNAVVLLREQSISLDSSGKLITVERYAVRILNREGRREASAVAFYLSNFSKVTNMEAWTLPPSGAVKTYGKKDTIDRISDTDDIYDEGRIKIIDASGDVDTGYVFGYTATTEDKPLFYQDKWVFQDDLPTLVSRYSLSLPAGWTASSVTFNREDVKPQINGSTYTWELRDLPPIPREPLSPSFVNIAPRIAVNYLPPDGKSTGRTFSDWNEAATWTAGLYEPAVVVDDAVAIKARELTANAKTELDKIRAIGSYVQNLQYISIDIGVGYGNGLRPRPSNLVLNRGYGDCKDKANLMRALLRTLKIESYPLAIYSGDPTFVRKEWASPSQFNHAILAVKVSPETVTPTVIDHPSFGRLMIFDATDPYTAVGDLPDHLQGSYAMLISEKQGGLIQMPVTPPDFNAWKRETSVTLSETGALKGSIKERTTGQPSTGLRGMYRSLSAADFSKTMERWLARNASSARLDKLTADDRHADREFDIDLEFTVPAYAQLMQNRLLVFKPAVVSRSNYLNLGDKDRTHPILLDATSFYEKVVFDLPTGFEVDEMPDAVDITSSFGTYSAKYEVKDHKLVYIRALKTDRSTIPVDKYGEVRSFFARMADAEQTPVVLMRK